MSRILLTGIDGQVGWELQRSLQPLGEIIALNRSGLNLSDPDQIRKVIRSEKTSIIVNPAAYTAVDKAETEIDQAFSINAIAPGILAEEARRLDALLVHYSTDYVFDGHQKTPYKEEDTPAPLGVYGRSKLEGERAIQAVGGRHLIFRTCWVYSLRGHNFLRTILRIASERDELKVVSDQVGAPTWSRLIAETSALALARYSGQNGIYHLTAGNSTSWYEFAREIVKTASILGLLAKPPPLVTPISTKEYPTNAIRPLNSRLDCTRLTEAFNLHVPDWLSQFYLCINAAVR